MTQIPESPSEQDEAYDDDIDRILDEGDLDPGPDPLRGGPQVAANFLRDIARSGTPELNEQLPELVIDHLLPLAATVAQLPKEEQRAVVSVLLSRVLDAVIPLKGAASLLLPEH